MISSDASRTSVQDCRDNTEEMNRNLVDTMKEVVVQDNQILRNAVEDSFNQKWIHLFRTEMAKLSAFLSVVLIIALANESGIIVDLIYSLEALKKEVHLEGIEIGRNLSKYIFEFNGVLLFGELGLTEVISEVKYTFHGLEEWNIIAVPLIVDGRMIGSISMFFTKEHSSVFAAPFLYQLANVITRETEKKDTITDLNNIEQQLDLYKLSPREKEVATNWYMEKSALYISTLLGIKEGTVRNTLNNIYIKMNVTDRRQFIKKLT